MRQFILFFIIIMMSLSLSSQSIYHKEWIDFNKNGYLLVSLISVDKGLYTKYALIKIPLNNPNSASRVDIKESEFAGFDGMVVTPKGNIIGVTNNQKTAGGNMLIELESKDNYKSAEVINYKNIKPSTTVAITPNGIYYVINQDFSDNNKKSRSIEQIKF